MAKKNAQKQVTNITTAVETIEARREAAEKATRRLDCFESIIGHIRNQMEWHCDYATDEEGNIVEDENGNRVLLPPTANEYAYARFAAWSDVLAEIMEML